MSNNIHNHLKEKNNREVQASIENIIAALNEEGYSVEFGQIGSRTTYALLMNPEKDDEIVGYTFISNLRYYDERIGRLKALQQAVARKELAKNSRKGEVN